MNDSGAIVKTRRRRFSVGRLIDDFIVLATGQFLAKVFGFIAFAWLARMLTIEDYGAVETAVGMSAIGIVAIELGTGSVGVRRIAQREAAPGQVLSSVVVARLIIAAVIAPILAVGYAVMTSAGMPDLLFAAFAVSLFAFPFNHNWFFQSQEKMAIAGFGQTLKMGVFLLAIFLLAPDRNGVLRVGVAELIAVSAMAVWYSLLAHRELGPLRRRSSLRDGLLLVRESGPLGASAVVNTAGQYFPIVIVAAFSTSVETAEFGASQRLVVSLVTFTFVYYFNLYPLMARRIVDDRAGLADIMGASVRVTAWVGVMGAAILSALAPLVMGLVFGEGFERAGSEFGLLAWNGALILGSGNARWLLVVGQRENSLLAAQSLSVVAIILFCLLLTPKFGAVGASIACIVGSIVLWIVAHWRTRGLPVQAPLLGNAPALVAAILAIAAGLLWRSAPMAAGAAAFGIVAAGMILDREFRSSIRILARAKTGA